MARTRIARALTLRQIEAARAAGFQRLHCETEARRCGHHRRVFACRSSWDHASISAWRVARRNAASERPVRWATDGTVGG